MRSKFAMAIPVTFLILLVSTLGIISVTYYFSVEKINSQNQTFKVSTAKQDMLALDNAVLPTLWQPGSSRTIEISDSGGRTSIQPTENILTISVSDSSIIDETVFNMTVGRVVYELPYAESSDTGVFLKGDSRTISNQSGSSLTQLCIANGANNTEIQLRYRPTVSYTTAGLENNKATNYVRLYLVNLNSSDAMALYGNLPLKISCVNTEFTTNTYDLSYQPEKLQITSILDGNAGSVTVPISSTDSGAIIYLEIVSSNIKIERWIR